MDFKDIHSSQIESLSELKVCGNVDFLETTSDHNENSIICDKAIQVDIMPDFNDKSSATHFSGIGEEISLMSETAVSRANSLKYEGDYYSLETVFTSDEYSDMSPEYILQTVVPIIEKFDVCYIWNIFKNVIENRMTSLTEENSSEIEWLKEPTFRLAKILYYLSKKMLFMQAEPVNSIITVDKWSNVLISELLKGLPSTFSEKTQDEVKEKTINRQDLNKLLCKTDELQHQIICLRNENAQIQDMLADAGKNLENANEENFHLKNQLYRAKVNLNEIDNLTSEVWSLKTKLLNYERSDRRKRRRLQEIEEQKTVLFVRVHDVEEKVQRWHSIVEDAKNEINSLKGLIRVQEKRVMSAIQEKMLTEIHINELTQINSDLESSAKQLIEANDALRSDKYILEQQLDEMQFFMNREEREDGCHKTNTSECMYSILLEDSKASEKESNSSSVQINAANERVNADLQKSIEIKSGSSSLQKNLGSNDNAKGFLDEEVGLEKKNSASGKSLICHTSDVRDQINDEIRALREQLVRSQVLFTYLLKDGSTDHTPKGLDCKTHLRTLLEEGNLSDVIFQCKSFDGQVPARFYNRSNRSSSSYASHRSTPMHCGYTSQSCPTLPIESPVVTKATQTEPMTGETFYMRTGTNGVLSATSSNSLNKGNVFFSPPSTPCENICEPLVITDVCEVHREPDNHSFPRHRTNSFLSAVKDGNPKLIDATESNARSSEFDDSVSYSEKKRSKKSSFIDNIIETEYFEQSSKAIDSELKGVIEDNKSENVAGGKKPSTDQQGISTAIKPALVKPENDTRSADEKTENKEKIFKTSQRSMRRGSGAGSPNSQLNIPRYPAFDFGEQEDAQSLFPSPSEPEANRNIKAEILQGMKNSESASDVDSNQSSSKSLKETSQKKRDTNKSKTLMPELMENSETESAKGSFECEAPDLPPSVDAPPVPIVDIAFPSLPNTFLAKLGVHKDSPLSVEAFDEQELESKFIALSLAFKTDRTTLSKRLELHKRHRDMAEKNVENEFQSMRDHLNALNLKATKADVRELISKIQNHLDIAQQATARVSGRSETYGAVQQEERVSRAFEVLVLHVDHLKRLFDKEHKELEETRRMLTDTQAFRKDVVGENVTEDQKKYLRAFGLPVGAIKSVFSLSSLLSIFRLSFKVGRRRASVAEFHQSAAQEIRRPPGFNQSWTSGYGARKVEPGQRTLCPFPTASSVGLSSSSLPTSQVTSISPSRISTASISARRCSLPAASPLVPSMLQNLEATPKNLNLTVQPLPSDNKQKKKERNLWSRKLSSVRDEQDEEECEDEKRLFPNQSPSEVTKHLAISSKSLDSEAYFQQFDADDESEGMSDSEEDNNSESTIFQIFRISSMKDLFNQGIQKLREMMLQYYPGEIDVRNIWTYPFIIKIILFCIWIFLSMEIISSLFVSV